MVVSEGEARDALLSIRMCLSTSPWIFFPSIFIERSQLTSKTGLRRGSVTSPTIIDALACNDIAVDNVFLTVKGSHEKDITNMNVKVFKDDHGNTPRAY